MATIEIIGIPGSTYVRAARMACEEKGVPYELKPVMPHSPEALAIHPFGKIPVMRHGDVELCESRAIAAYIDRAFDGPPLFPSEPRELALAEQWISLVNTAIDQVLIRQYLFAYVFPKTEDGKPDRKTIDAVAPKMREHLALLDNAVAATGYLAGDRYSFADMNLMPILFYVRQSSEGGEALAKSSHLAAYYERNAARPAFKNTIPPPPPARQAASS